MAMHIAVKLDSLLECLTPYSTICRNFYDRTGQRDNS